jgi:hypothetical protein
MSGLAVALEIDAIVAGSHLGFRDDFIWVATEFDFEGFAHLVDSHSVIQHCGESYTNCPQSVKCRAVSMGVAGHEKGGTTAAFFARWLLA